MPAPASGPAPRGARPPLVLLAVVVSSIVLSRVHTLAPAEHRSLVLVLASAPMWMAITVWAARLVHRRSTPDAPMPRAARIGLGAMAMVLSISFLRAASQGAASPEDVMKHLFGWGTLALFALTAGRVLPRATFRGAVLCSVALYVGLNVGLVAWTVLTGRGGFGVLYGRASMLSSMGIEMERVLFPTSPGFNSFGIMAGAAVAGLLPVLWRARSLRLRGVCAVALAFALGGLLLSDNRVALVAGVASGAVLAVGTTRLLWTSTWAPALSPLLPVTFVLLVGAFTELSPSSALIRNAESTGTNVRLEVWNVILDRLTEPSMDHVVGYGHMGHVSSGVSLEYVPVVFRQLAVIPGVASFETDLDIRVTAHNFVLQSILDHGYGGAAVLLLLLGCLMRQVWREIREHDRPVDRAMLALLLFMLMIGTTETVFAVYNAEAFGLMVLAAVACARREMRTEPRAVRWRAETRPGGSVVPLLRPEAKGA